MHLEKLFLLTVPMQFLETTTLFYVEGEDGLCSFSSFESKRAAGGPPFPLTSRGLRWIHLLFHY